MKRLPKHRRPRWRYLAVAIETWPTASLDRDALAARLETAARSLVGAVGSAGLGLSVLRFDYRAGVGRCVLRVRRGAVQRARAVVACVDTVAGQAVGMRVRGVAGTVRACEEKYLGREPESPRQRTVVFENVESDATVRDGRVDVRRDDAFAGAATRDLQ